MNPGLVNHLSTCQFYNVMISDIETETVNKNLIESLTENVSLCTGGLNVGPKWVYLNKQPDKVTILCSVKLK